MTPGQKRTVKRLAVAGCIFLALVVWLLYSEARGLAEGAEQAATISELVWMAYAKQQWPFMLLGLAFAYVVGFISGHFFAQRASVYDDIRRGGETADAAALEAAAPKRAGSSPAPGTTPRWPMSAEERASFERAYRAEDERVAERLDRIRKGGL